MQSDKQILQKSNFSYKMQNKKLLYLVRDDITLPLSAQTLLFRIGEQLPPFGNEASRDPAEGFVEQTSQCTSYAQVSTGQRERFAEFDISL